MSDKHLIFVYGTLRRDCGGVKIQGEYRGCDVISGTLYDLGWYPGVRDVPNDFVTHFWDNEGNVLGEVYEIDDEELARLDMYEGCGPNPELVDSGLYYRKQTRTFRGLTVWVYVYSDAPSADDRIHNGDWFWHSKMKKAA